MTTSSTIINTNANTSTNKVAAAADADDDGIQARIEALRRGNQQKNVEEVEDDGIQARIDALRQNQQQQPITGVEEEKEEDKYYQNHDENGLDNNDGGVLARINALKNGNTHAEESKNHNDELHPSTAHNKDSDDVSIEARIDALRGPEPETANHQTVTTPVGPSPYPVDDDLQPGAYPIDEEEEEDTRPALYPVNDVGPPGAYPIDDTGSSPYPVDDDDGSPGAFPIDDNDNEEPAAYPVDEAMESQDAYPAIEGSELDAYPQDTADLQCPVIDVYPTEGSAAYPVDEEEVAVATTVAHQLNGIPDDVTPNDVIPNNCNNTGVHASRTAQTSNQSTMKKKIVKVIQADKEVVGLMPSHLQKKRKVPKAKPTRSAYEKFMDEV